MQPQKSIEILSANNCETKYSPTIEKSGNLIEIRSVRFDFQFRWLCSVLPCGKKKKKEQKKLINVAGQAHGHGC